MNLKQLNRDDLKKLRDLKKQRTASIDGLCCWVCFSKEAVDNFIKHNSKNIDTDWHGDIASMPPDLYETFEKHLLTVASNLPPNMYAVVYKPLNKTYSERK
jgi:hypothetical protein